MKVGIIAQPNQKGQVVIPKAYRKALGIDAEMPLHMVIRGRGIYLYPIHEVIGKVDTEQSYAKVLERTQGAWGKAGEAGRFAAQKKKIELRASEKRKSAW